MVREYTLALFFIVIIVFKSNAQIESLVLNDSTLTALSRVENLKDFQSTIRQSRITDTSETLTIDELLFIINVLHRQSELVYQNHIEELNVCYKLTEEYLLEYKDILKSLKLFSTPERTAFLDVNLKKYLGRLVFDFYYINENIGFLRDEVQVKSLNPSSINEMLRNAYQADSYISELKFISNNSQVLLFKN